MNRRPLIIAHRGASADAPENTLAAFRLGLAQGCEGIELDVHLSADEAVIVCHDETLERTTSGAGRIDAHTAAELRTFDAGGWFGAAYAGERLPLLDEVLDLVPARIPINIEIKSHDHPNVERRVLELLERRGRLDSVFFSSFDHACMARLKKLEPRARIGLLYEEETVDYGAFFRDAGIEGYSLHPEHVLIDGGYVEAAARGGLQVYVWTVDDPDRMCQLAEWGVAGIITNRPQVLRELLEREHGRG